MSWRLRVGILFAAAVSLDAGAGLAAGVPRELARERAGAVRALRYDIDAALDAKADVLRGRLTLRFDLARPRAVALDYRPANAPAPLWRVNGRERRVAVVDQHVRLESAWLKAGVNRVELEFAAPIAASGSALTRYEDREDGARYVYSLFVPADASSVFPCFDQPDLKAHWKLALTVPGGWRAVSNGPLARAFAVPGGLRHEFAPTRPLPTYLFAFAAGPFETLAEAGGADATRLHVRRSQRERAAREAPEMLKLSRESIDFFARYFDHPYPFARRDLVLLPEFPYGGMEHAGVIFLREEAMLFRAPPTAIDRLRRANTILHENAHQWFGNLVTMRWFDDLWLKEGFANFAAAKAVEALLPEFDAWNALRAAKVAAYRTDATPGTTAIHQPLPNLADAKSAYGAIVYTKAPAVLRQAEFYLGEAAFARAVKSLVRSRAYGNATWQDMVRAFEAASGRDLRDWASAWVERRGLATVRVERAEGAAALVQADTLGEGGMWPMRFNVALVAADGAMQVRPVDLAGARAELGAVPDDALLVPNAGDFGYGRFLLDETSRAALLARPDRVRDNLTRALAFDALWEETRDAHIAPAEYLRFALTALPLEGDPVTSAGLLARASHAFRAWMSDAQRDVVAGALEGGLAERMRSGPTPGERLAAMRTLIDCAWSGAAQAQLVELLDGAFKVNDAALAPRDRFAIVARLLQRGHAEAEARLAQETARAAGEDTASFAFAAGAARGDAAAKARYLARFLDDASLPEDWIDQALVPLNGVEHATLTAPLFARALEALPTLKRRHKIFFVGRWLEAFVGGQVDADSLASLRAFAARPDLEADLGRKVLEAADALERTVRVRAAFAGSR